MNTNKSLHIYQRATLIAFRHERTTRKRRNEEIVDILVLALSLDYEKDIMATVSLMNSVLIPPWYFHIVIFSVAHRQARVLQWRIDCHICIFSTGRNSFTRWGDCKTPTILSIASSALIRLGQRGCCAIGKWSHSCRITSCTGIEDRIIVHVANLKVWGGSIYIPISHDLSHRNLSWRNICVWLEYSYIISMHMS